MFETGKTYEFRMTNGVTERRRVEEFSFPLVKLAAEEVWDIDPLTGERTTLSKVRSPLIVNISSAAFLYASEEPEDEG